MPASKEETRTFNIRLPIKLYERLEQVADSENRTVNNLVVKYLKEKHPEYKPAQPASPSEEKPDPTPYETKP